LPAIEPADLAAATEPAIFHEPGAGWSLWLPCEGCGGHRLALGPKSRGTERLARTRGEAFLLYVRGRFCIGCRAKAWREDPFTPYDGESYLWWDTVTDEWMAWVPFPGSDAGISFPLGVHSFWEKPKAKAAARGVWEAPVPLSISDQGAPPARDGAAIWHDADSGRWLLWSPCSGCGGVELDLSVARGGAVGGACSRAVSALERIHELGCPQCRSIDAKYEGQPPVGIEQLVWYDTEAREWMLSRRMEGVEDALVLPLGIGHFDADGQELMHASVHFLDEGLFLEGDEL